MTAYRWITSHAPAGLQQAKITRSLPKWTLWLFGPLCDYCGTDGHQHFFGTFHSDRRFDHEGSGCKIPRTWFRLFFWQKTRLLWLLRLLTLLIWLSVTFGCFPNSRGYWKESDYRQERSVWLQRQPCYTPFRKRLSQNVPNNDGAPAQSVWSTK